MAIGTQCYEKIENKYGKINTGTQGFYGQVFGKNSLPIQQATAVLIKV